MFLGYSNKTKIETREVYIGVLSTYIFHTFLGVKQKWHTLNFKRLKLRSISRLLLNSSMMFFATGHTILPTFYLKKYSLFKSTKENGALRDPSFPGITHLVCKLPLLNFYY